MGSPRIALGTPKIPIYVKSEGGLGNLQTLHLVSKVRVVLWMARMGRVRFEHWLI